MYNTLRLEYTILVTSYISYLTNLSNKLYPKTYSDIKT